MCSGKCCVCILDGLCRKDDWLDQFVPAKCHVILSRMRTERYAKDRQDMMDFLEEKYDYICTEGRFKAADD